MCPIKEKLGSRSPPSRPSPSPSPSPAATPTCVYSAPMSHQPRTHLAIDARLVGHPVHLADGTALVRLETTKDMAADDRSLVHGGFVFGLADYAAMLAVNEPTVVLAAAHLTFL